MAKLFLLFFFTLLSLIGTGQCLDDLAHNTSIDGVWLSCQRSMNPLTEFGQSHWIMYEFDEAQSIESMRLWNLNRTDQLTSGAKRMRMDISMDGATWANMGVIELDMSDGSRDYVGLEVDEIGAFNAQFVLFTILENHGGSCFGLSEVQFNLGETTVDTQDEYLSTRMIVSPNPVDSELRLTITDILTRSISYQLVDMKGRVLAQQKLNTTGSAHQIIIDGAALANGQYALKVDTDQGSATKKVLVIHPN